MSEVHSNDLVTRLRNEYPPNGCTASLLMEEAANEIERLRRLNRELAAECWNGVAIR